MSKKIKKIFKKMVNFVLQKSYSILYFNHKIKDIKNMSKSYWSVSQKIPFVKRLSFP